jgi:hypothetical protein
MLELRLKDKRMQQDNESRSCKEDQSPASYRNRKEPCADVERGGYRARRHH